MECLLSYLSESFRELNGVKGNAVIEYSVSNFSHAAGEFNGCKESAVTECLLFYFTESLRELNEGKGGAVIECREAYFSQATGEFD